MLYKAMPLSVLSVIAIFIAKEEYVKIFLHVNA
jgi:hypothetical protein